MKALVFHLSPKMENSNTSLILNPFMEGLKEQGVDIELFYTAKLNIKDCLLNQDCYYKTPGKCTIDDDVAMLLDKAKEADIWVFAMPVIADGAPSTFHNLLLRLVILLTEPYILIKNGLTTHPLREKRSPHTLVLVSSCGYWELETFNPMVNYVKNFCKRREELLDYKGILARPHGAFLRAMAEADQAVDDIFIACRQAGIDLIEKGGFDDDVLATISRPLVTQEQLTSLANNYISAALKNI